MGKIFITGPGRSGTTFLVQLLTRLGFDTGFQPYNEVYVESWRAGCERNIPFDIATMSHEELRSNLADGPEIIKGPVWAYLLKYIYINKLAAINHVVMPIRDLSVSTESRLDVGLEYGVGVVEWVSDVDKHEVQENVLAMLVGKVLEVCYVYRIPLTLMRFPTIVFSEDYCYRKVNSFVKVERSKFGEVYRDLANPEQIRHRVPDRVKPGDTA